MRKLLTFLIALGAVALVTLVAPTKATAGCMALLGVGSVNCGAAPPPVGVVLTYQSTAIGSASGSNALFGTITIGAAPSANRRVIVVFEIPSGNPGVLPVSATFTPNSGSPITADTVSFAGQDTSRMRYRPSFPQFCRSGQRLRCQ
jgi:hypothetical protein